MRTRIAWVALAIALPTAALAGDEHSRVMRQHYAMERDGQLQQAMEEAKANVQAFKQIQEQRRAQRETPVLDGRYASGTGNGVVKQVRRGVAVR